MKTKYDIVSPTAVLCARARADITDMPYTKEIYEQIKSQKCALNLLYPFLIRAVRAFPNLATRGSTLEGRYISTNEALQRLGGCDILELASGVSPRGLEHANGEIVYVESDLPDMIAEKERAVKAIRAEEGRPVKNHFFESINPIHDDLGNFAGRFNGNPVAVVNEGLLMYLTLDEQKRVRDNISNFLHENSHNGAWITPDFSYTATPATDRSLVGLAKWRIRKSTREGNRFKSEQEAKDFLKCGGLKVEILPNSHLADNLSTVKILEMDVERVRKYMKNCRSWYITSS